MTPTVVAVVLCGALLHAVWNALVKGGRDPFFGSVLVASGAALLSLPLLPILAQPAAASWPYLAASTVIHFAYYGLLAAAYRHGDMSHAYPLMRGSAPLLVAAASVPLLGEHLSPLQYAAVACISGGILSLWFATTPVAAKARGRATAFALLNALVIAVYTLIDGIGARASGAPAAYVMWLHVMSAIGLLAWCALRCPRQLRDYALQHWRIALLGGAGTLGAYGLALWAMTVAPLAAVAALRETSILFAALIAKFFLGERIGRKRALAITAIAAGAVLMRIA
ncbi:EamA family transporter [Pseudoduganella sp. DS3]|uniref:EamA family transporter n=1 Tax=Pseudoduganella guangdongensis TaxID=2692179 RepID=A0A6N9HLV6_9BURK|nr:DMT family transporter [Pseudoduganella guangdongensis]MYN04651.1 EamA family transporter [Pseudoduganella guangdongensis]